PSPARTPRRSPCRRPCRTGRQAIPSPRACHGTSGMPRGRHGRPRPSPGWPAPAPCHDTAAPGMVHSESEQAGPAACPCWAGAGMIVEGLVIGRTDAMAPLRWPDDADRLDFDLLRESPVTLYRSREVLAEHIAWLRRHGYVVHEFDCSGSPLISLQGSH